MLLQNTDGREVDVHSIWDEVVGLLSTEMSEAARNTYLRSLEPMGLDGAVFTIGTTTDFARAYLQDKYAGLFARAVSDVLHKNVVVKFALSPNHRPLEHLIGPMTVPAVAAPVVAQESKPNAFAATDLNPKYVFENFVVGRSNQLAHAAALNVARSPGTTYNPLFLYGGVGLGKTHLMQAIGHFAMEEHPELRVVYISGETFLNHVVTAIRDSKTDAFRRSYRSVDLWLVDDIQFIASKEQSRTEAEFFHTFNALYETNKQIVISSDRPPRDLQIMDDRLKSRFEMGLLTDMRMPDEETRVAILQKKAHLESVIVPDDVMHYIAQLIRSSVRALEGALTRVIATASLTRSEVNLENTQAWLADFSANTEFRRVTPRQVRDVVARHFGIKPEELTGKRRDKAIVVPRQIAMYLSRSLTESSTVKIGAAFGGRDHTTVLHACSKITSMIDADPGIAQLLDDLTTEIEASDSP